MIPTRLSTASIASGVALLLISAGCGSGNNSETEAPTARTEVQAGQNQMNPQPRESLQQGGTMVWAIDEAIANFNLNQLDGNTLMADYVISGAMPNLFTFDAAGTPSYRPDYLTEEPRLDAGPPQVVTYELNPKAIWYDGTPITAADFIAQWKALHGDNTDFHIAASNGYDHIQNVAQGSNPYEVVVTFETPYADWKALFSPLYPAATNSDPNIFNDGWKEGMLTSGGPFKLQNYDVTAKTYTLVPNEKWWGNKPKLDELLFRVIDDDATPAALANGEVDLMDVGPSANYYDRVKNVAGVDIRVAGGANFRVVTMNGQSPMLQDVRVRQALAMAIDRTAIARAELGPLPVVPASLGNHIFMANQAGYQDNSGVVAYDPAKARQLLDEAGWVLENGKRVKNGETLTINFVIPSGIAVSRSESELIQNMLAQVHVDVNINTVPGDNFFDQYVTPGQFDFTVFSWFGTPFPIGDAVSLYRKPVGDQIQQNYARIGNDELDQALSAAVEELDPQKAIEKANEVDRLVWEEVNSLTLYQRPDIWAAKQKLANMGATGLASFNGIVYEDIGWMP